MRREELLLRVDRRQPEAELVGEVVARAARAVALDERRRAEVLETRAGTRQRLTAALGARRRVLHARATTSPAYSARTARNSDERVDTFGQTIK